MAIIKKHLFERPNYIAIQLSNILNYILEILFPVLINLNFKNISNFCISPHIILY